MANSRILLTDAESGVSLDQYFLQAPGTVPLGGQPEWFVRLETLRGGKSEGVQVVTLNNGPLTVCVLPTRGMNIWKAGLRGVEAGWRSPVEQLVHPRFVPVDHPNGLGWLHGFNELVARCGLASNGPPGDDAEGHPLENPLTLHGRVSNLPAHRLELMIEEGSPTTIRLEGVIDETSLFGTSLRLTSSLSMRLGSTECVIEDRITNLSGKMAEAQLLYHINVGSPILEEGARIIAPASEIAPRDARAAEGISGWDVCGPPESGFTEQVYYLKPLTDDDDKAMVMMRNAAGNKGLSVHFDRRQLPYLSLWKNLAALSEGYVVGLEPATNYPNHRQFERSQGRVVSLEPGASHEARVRLTLHDGLEDVAYFEALAEGIAEGKEFTEHEEPRKGWSAGV